MGKLTRIFHAEKSLERSLLINKDFKNNLTENLNLNFFLVKKQSKSKKFNGQFNFFYS